MLDMLKREKKWNHIKCSIQTIKGRKLVEDEIGTKNKGNK